MRISDVVRISDGYADLLSVDIRVSYRWVPRNRVGAFILRSKFHPPIGRWWFMRVKLLMRIPLCARFAIILATMYVALFIIIKLG